MINFKRRNYGISRFEIDVTNSNHAPIHAPRQFFSDVQWLLDNMGHYIKNLVLSMSVVTDRKGIAFKKILKNLTNVENLDLSLDINTNLIPMLGSNSALVLPSVKRLSLWVHDIEGDDMRDPLKNHIVGEMAKLFPNLQGNNDMK